MNKFHPEYDGLSTEFMNRLISAIMRADNGPGEYGYWCIDKVQVGSTELRIADGMGGEVWIHNLSNKETVALTEHNAYRVIQALNGRSRELKHLAAAQKHTFNSL
jgi:hypothetical protein